jgi:hypothetical protein
MTPKEKRVLTESSGGSSLYLETGAEFRSDCIIPVTDLNGLGPNFRSQKWKEVIGSV